MRSYYGCTGLRITRPRLRDRYSYPDPEAIAGFSTINRIGNGSLIVGPVLHDRREGPNEIQNRIHSASRLKNMFSLAAALNAHEESSQYMLSRLLIRIAIDSVFQPISTISIYTVGDLLVHEARRKLARKLLLEAAAVVGSVIPMLTFEFLEKHSFKFVRQYPNNIAPMLVRAREGKQSTLEFNCETIIRLANHFNLDVPLQKLMVAKVNKITVDSAIAIQTYATRPREKREQIRKETRSGSTLDQTRQWAKAEPVNGKVVSDLEHTEGPRLRYVAVDNPNGAQTCRKVYS